jgi:hypothetical protein
MPFFDAANLVHVDDPRSSVTCHYCDGDAFGRRRIKVNTAGAEFFGFAVSPSRSRSSPA